MVIFSVLKVSKYFKIIPVLNKWLKGQQCAGVNLITIREHASVYLQVHLNKLECREKVNFFL